MAQFSSPVQIGHNSIQTPHDGKLVKGAEFKPASFACPTGMSVAMAKAGSIPGEHMIMVPGAIATLRHKKDFNNVNPSITIRV